MLNTEQNIYRSTVACLNLCVNIDNSLLFFLFSSGSNRSFVRSPFLIHQLHRNVSTNQSSSHKCSIRLRFLKKFLLVHQFSILSRVFFFFFFFFISLSLCVRSMGKYSLSSPLSLSLSLSREITVAVVGVNFYFSLNVVLFFESFQHQPKKKKTLLVKCSFVRSFVLLDVCRWIKFFYFGYK